MSKESILVVEDEEDILELLTFNLGKEGYRILQASDGESALEIAQREKPDLVLLDLMLPGLDGLDVCRRLKQERSTRNILVVMLTAKGEESDIVAGLETGADDYLTKPFSPRVVLAHLRAVLRRKSRALDEEENLVRRGPLEIDVTRHAVRVDSTSLDLTSTEFGVLLFLSRRPGWVFTRQQIVDSVRGEDYAVTERAVDVQIVGLRRKLGDYANLIETVRGVGYRFKEI